MAQSSAQQRAEERRRQKEAQRQARAEMRQQERLNRIEEEGRKKIKNMYVEKLLEAMNNDEDLSTYASIIEDNGFSFEECANLAIERKKEEVEQARWNSLKSAFQKSIEKDYNCKLEDLSMQYIKDTWEYEEDKIKEAFAETQKDIYEALLSQEKEKDASSDEDMEHLNTLGEILGHNKKQIIEDIEKERKERADRIAKEKYAKAEGEFVSKWNKYAWILIGVLCIIEIIFTKWWTILIAPATMGIILPISKAILKAVFKSQYKKA